MTSRFRITGLGAQGDGIAETEKGPVFIPFALPGEEVIAAVERGRGTLISVLEPSPLRVEPPCKHFGTCGGCAVQHLAPEAYREWKRDKAVQALAARGIEAEVAALVPCAPYTRRRVAFSARQTAGRMLLGFNRHLSNEIIDIEECHIALPEIVAAREPLRALAGLICATPKPFKMTVTATASGLDIAAAESGKLTDAARRRAADFVIREGFARLSIDGEIIIEPKKPIVMFGDVPVAIPPGAFLQATASAEEFMAGLVSEHLSRARKVTDLFSGSGTFALRLAHVSEVHAVESDAAALAALDRAFRGAQGLKRVTVEKRDLFRRPLAAKELNGFDGVILDPPRAGAEDQSKQLARSDVPRVAAVSCNPATMARDLRILIDGGYRLTSVTPIDQFLWSPHVEAVALLEKPKKRR